MRPKRNSAKVSPIVCKAQHSSGCVVALGCASLALKPSPQTPGGAGRRLTTPLIPLTLSSWCCARFAEIAWPPTGWSHDSEQGICQGPLGLHSTSQLPSPATSADDFLTSSSALAGSLTRDPPTQWIETQHQSTRSRNMIIQAWRPSRYHSSRRLAGIISSRTWAMALRAPLGLNRRRWPICRPSRGRGYWGYR